MKKIKKLVEWFVDNYSLIKRYIKSIFIKKSNSLLQRKELIDILVENNLQFLQNTDGSVSLWQNSSGNNIYQFNSDGTPKYNSEIFTNKDTFEQVILKIKTYLANGFF